MELRTRRVAATALFALLAFPSTVHAATYYVRQTGKDTGKGTSASTAFRTIAKATSVAKTGDLIYVGAGTYAEAVVINAPASGKKTYRLYADTTGTRTGDVGEVKVVAPITGPALKVTGDRVYVQGIAFSGGSEGVVWTGTLGRLLTCSVSGSKADAVRLLSSGATTITSLVVSGCGGDGLRVEGAQTVTLSKSAFSAIGGDGIEVVAAGATANVTMTTLTKGSGRAVAVTGGNVSLTNVLAAKFEGGGVVASASAGNVTSTNSTFAFNGVIGIDLAGGNGTVRNTIIAQHKRGVRLAGTAKLTHNNNLYFGNGLDYDNTKPGTSDVLGDPRFVEATSDYRIRANSLAVDAGQNLASTVKSDLLSMPRPSGKTHDIGAYESAGTPAAIPYFTDFEAATGAEWGQSTRTTATTLGNFSGRFGTPDTAAQALLLTTKPGVEYTVVFDLYVVDSWDGDSDDYGPDEWGVDVDGKVVMRESINFLFSGYTGSFPDWPDWWGPNVLGASWGEGIFRGVTFSFTAQGNQTQVTFFDSVSEGLANESWGLDNVRVIEKSLAAPYVPLFTESGWAMALPTRTTTASVYASGIHSADIDNDADLDLILTGNSSATVMRYDASTKVFVSETLSKPDVRGQAAIADFDNDGDIDFWVPGTADFNTETYFNNLSGKLAASGPAGFVQPVSNEGAVAADVNRDGHLDLVVFCNQLGVNWVGLSDGESPPVFSGVDGATYGLGGKGDSGDGDFCSSADVNNDGHLDFFYHWNGGRLFLSNAEGGYTSAANGIALPATHLSAKGATRLGSAWGDFNNDGNVDLAVASPWGGYQLWKNGGDGAKFSNVNAAILSKTASVTGKFRSCTWGDIDNDGDLDLFLLGSENQSQLLRNAGAPAYTLSPVDLGCNVLASGHDCSFVDIDNDSDLDLVITGDNTLATSSPFVDRVKLYTNSLNDGRGMNVRIVGHGEGGTNKAGVGISVELYDASGRTRLGRREIGVARGMGTTPLWAHFGVTPTTAYILKTKFPDGEVSTTVVPGKASTVINGITVARLLTITEPEREEDVAVVRWREASPDER